MRIGNGSSRRWVFPLAKPPATLPSVPRQFSSRMFLSCPIVGCDDTATPSATGCAFGLLLFVIVLPRALCTQVLDEVAHRQWFPSSTFHDFIQRLVGTARIEVFLKINTRCL